MKDLLGNPVKQYAAMARYMHTYIIYIYTYTYMQYTYVKYI